MAIDKGQQCDRGCVTLQTHDNQTITGSLVVRYHVARGELVNHTDAKDLIAEKRQQAAIKNADVIATSSTNSSNRASPRSKFRGHSGGRTALASMRRSGSAQTSACTE
jgi:hypothetical protein